MRSSRLKSRRVGRSGEPSRTASRSDATRCAGECRSARGTYSKAPLHSSRFPRVIAHGYFGFTCSFPPATNAKARNADVAR
jgi:hypothetical protein